MSRYVDFDEPIRPADWVLVCRAIDIASADIAWDAWRYDELTIALDKIEAEFERDGAATWRLFPEWFLDYIATTIDRSMAGG
jgi:hypothetical protein